MKLDGNRGVQRAITSRFDPDRGEEFTRVWDVALGWSSWVKNWNTGNTTVDINGFIKEV